MMYCAVDEAFDNPLRQQMKQLENEKNNNKHKEALMKNVENEQKNNNLQPPHFNGENYTVQHPEYNPSYFNAQGDLEDDTKGTLISQLQNDDDDEFDDDKFSMNTASDFFDNYQKDKKKKKVKHSHSYYIKCFIDKLTNEEDLSIGSFSSGDSGVFDHVKSCKYCRMMVNQKMKNNNQPTLPPSPKIDRKNDKIMGYDLKEVAIIILIGVIIIFILDLLVRIGRSTGKMK